MVDPLGLRSRSSGVVESYSDMACTLLTLTLARPETGTGCTLMHVLVSEPSFFES